MSCLYLVFVFCCYIVWAKSPHVHIGTVRHLVKRNLILPSCCHTGATSTTQVFHRSTLRNTIPLAMPFSIKRRAWLIVVILCCVCTPSMEARRDMPANSAEAQRGMREPRDVDVRLSATSGRHDTEASATGDTGGDDSAGHDASSSHWSWHSSNWNPTNWSWNWWSSSSWSYPEDAPTEDEMVAFWRVSRWMTGGGQQAPPPPVETVEPQDLGYGPINRNQDGPRARLRENRGTFIPSPRTIAKAKAPAPVRDRPAPMSSSSAEPSIGPAPPLDDRYRWKPSLPINPNSVRTALHADESPLQGDYIPAARLSPAPGISAAVEAPAPSTPDPSTSGGGARVGGRYTGPPGAEPDAGFSRDGDPPPFRKKRNGSMKMLLDHWLMLQ